MDDEMPSGAKTPSTESMRDSSASPNGIKQSFKQYNGDNLKTERSQMNAQAVTYRPNSNTTIDDRDMSKTAESQKCFMNNKIPGHCSKLYKAKTVELATSESMENIQTVECVPSDDSQDKPMSNDINEARQTVVPCKTVNACQNEDACHVAENDEVETQTSQNSIATDDKPVDKAVSSINLDNVDSRLTKTSPCANPAHSLPQPCELGQGQNQPIQDSQLQGDVNLDSKMEKMSCQPETPQISQVESNTCQVEPIHCQVDKSVYNNVKLRDSNDIKGHEQENPVNAHCIHRSEEPVATTENMQENSSHGNIVHIDDNKHMEPGSHGNTNNDNVDVAKSKTATASHTEDIVDLGKIPQGSVQSSPRPQSSIPPRPMSAESNPSGPVHLELASVTARSSPGPLNLSVKSVKNGGATSTVRPKPLQKVQPQVQQTGIGEHLSQYTNDTLHHLKAQEKCFSPGAPIKPVRTHPDGTQPPPPIPHLIPIQDNLGSVKGQSFHNIHNQREYLKQPEIENSIAFPAGSSVQYQMPFRPQARFSRLPGDPKNWSKVAPSPDSIRSPPPPYHPLMGNLPDVPRQKDESCINPFEVPPRPTMTPQTSRHEYSAFHTPTVAVQERPTSATHPAAKYHVPMNQNQQVSPSPDPTVQHGVPNSQLRPMNRLEFLESEYERHQREIQIIQELTAKKEKEKEELVQKQTQMKMLLGSIEALRRQAYDITMDVPHDPVDPQSQRQTNNASIRPFVASMNVGSDPNIRPGNSRDINHMGLPKPLQTVGRKPFIGVEMDQKNQPQTKAVLNTKRMHSPEFKYSNQSSVHNNKHSSYTNPRPSSYGNTTPSTYLNTSPPIRRASTSPLYKSTSPAVHNNYTPSMKSAKVPPPAHNNTHQSNTLVNVDHRPPLAHSTPYMLSNNSSQKKEEYGNTKVSTCVQGPLHNTKLTSREHSDNESMIKNTAETNLHAEVNKCIENAIRNSFQEGPKPKSSELVVAKSPDVHSISTHSIQKIHNTVVTETLGPKIATHPKKKYTADYLQAEKAKLDTMVTSMTSSQVIFNTSFAQSSITSASSASDNISMTQNKANVSHDTVDKHINESPDNGTRSHNAKNDQSYTIERKENGAEGSETRAEKSETVDLVNCENVAVDEHTSSPVKLTLEKINDCSTAPSTGIGSTVSPTMTSVCILSSGNMPISQNSTIVTVSAFNGTPTSATVANVQPSKPDIVALTPDQNTSGQSAYVLPDLAGTTISNVSFQKVGRKTPELTSATPNVSLVSTSVSSNSGAAYSVAVDKVNSVTTDPTKPNSEPQYNVQHVPIHENKRSVDTNIENVAEQVHNKKKLPDMIDLTVVPSPKVNIKVPSEKCAQRRNSSQNITSMEHQQIQFNPANDMQRPRPRSHDENLVMLPRSEKNMRSNTDPNFMMTSSGEGLRMRAPIANNKGPRFLQSQVINMSPQRMPGPPRGQPLMQGHPSAVQMYAMPPSHPNLKRKFVDVIESQNCVNEKYFPMELTEAKRRKAEILEKQKVEAQKRKELQKQQQMMEHQKQHMMEQHKQQQMFEQQAQRMIEHHKQQVIEQKKQHLMEQQKMQHMKHMQTMENATKVNRPPQGMIQMVPISQKSSQMIPSQHHRFYTNELISPQSMPSPQPVIHMSQGSKSQAQPGTHPYFSQVPSQHGHMSPFGPTISTADGVIHSSQEVASNDSPTVMHGTGPPGMIHGPGPHGVMHGSGPQGNMHASRPHGFIHGPRPQGLMHSPGVQGVMHGPGPQGVMHSPGSQTVVQHSPTGMPQHVSPGRMNHMNQGQGYLQQQNLARSRGRPYPQHMQNGRDNDDLNGQPTPEKIMRGPHLMEMQQQPRTMLSPKKPTQVNLSSGYHHNNPRNMLSSEIIHEPMNQQVLDTRRELHQQMVLRQNQASFPNEGNRDIAKRHSTEDIPEAFILPQGGNKQRQQETYRQMLPTLPQMNQHWQTAPMQGFSPGKPQEHQQMLYKQQTSPRGYPQPNQGHPEGHHHRSHDKQEPAYLQRMIIPAEKLYTPKDGNLVLMSESDIVAGSKMCSICGREATFLCSGCKKMWYCSIKCQMAAWENTAQNAAN
ncbi:unnamed protein product [Owenia fusiformis]|uniref:MYND-type domain-containing protein n=1 Tax=Owenia fusiformis TaxID=6347 RepID=A0A8S4Q8U8_OWEFU|nr:unnamed protein product [Owenia fusiformis]